MKVLGIGIDKASRTSVFIFRVSAEACGHCAEYHSTEKPQCRKTQCSRSAEMGNVPIVLSSRVTEWHDVTSRNNQLNKQLKDITRLRIKAYL